MSNIDLKEMLEAGVHFGHKKDRWNPKMAPYIYAERNGVHIFDLTKTKENLEKAVNFISKTASEGGTVLFVGTKNQTKSVIREAAERASMPYLVERWPGGMLTNFNTILGRLKYLKDAEEKLAANGGEANVANMTKKEALNLRREMEKLQAVFGGVKEVRRVPDVVFVADLVKEKNAVREAKILGIPVVGIADTNAEPNVEYVIPGNDDAVRAVKYITDAIADAVSAHKKAAETAEQAEAPVVEPTEEEKAAAEDIEEKIEEKVEKEQKVAPKEPSEK